MQIGGLPAWPYVLMVSTLVAYQVLLKLPRPGLNILAFQTFAYAVALVAAAFLWWRNAGLGDNRMTAKEMILPVLFGLSVVGLEFAYVAAFRLGWPVSTTGVMVTVGTAVVLLPISYFAFRETLSPVNLAGLAVCAAGLWMVSLR